MRRDCELARTIVAGVVLVTGQGFARVERQ